MTPYVDSIWEVCNFLCMEERERECVCVCYKVVQLTDCNQQVCEAEQTQTSLKPQQQQI